MIDPKMLALRGLMRAATDFKKRWDEKELVIKIANGEFENRFGMTHEKFVELYKELVENEPDRLI